VTKKHLEYFIATIWLPCSISNTKKKKTVVTFLALLVRRLLEFATKPQIMTTNKPFTANNLVETMLSPVNNN
jgi:hypothetical protein